MPRGSRLATIKRKYGPKKIRQIARAIFAGGNATAGKEYMRAASAKERKRASVSVNRSSNARDSVQDFLRWTGV
jgi:hypothetical protein